MSLSKTHAESRRRLRKRLLAEGVDPAVVEHVITAKREQHAAVRRTGDTSLRQRITPGRTT